MVVGTVVVGKEGEAKAKAGVARVVEAAMAAGMAVAVTVVEEAT